MGLLNDARNGDGWARFVVGVTVVICALLIVSILMGVAFIASGHWLFWGLAFAIASVCFVGVMTLLAWLLNLVCYDRDGGDGCGPSI